MVGRKKRHAGAVCPFNKPPKPYSLTPKTCAPAPICSSGPKCGTICQGSSARAVISRGIPASSTPKVQTASRTLPYQTTAAGTAIMMQTSSPSYRSLHSPVSHRSPYRPTHLPRHEVIRKVGSPPFSQDISMSSELYSWTADQTNTLNQHQCWLVLHQSCRERGLPEPVQGRLPPHRANNREIFPGYGKCQYVGFGVRLHPLRQRL